MSQTHSCREGRIGWLDVFPSTMPLKRLLPSRGERQKLLAACRCNLLIGPRNLREKGDGHKPLQMKAEKNPAWLHIGHAHYRLPINTLWGDKIIAAKEIRDDGEVSRGF